VLGGRKEEEAAKHWGQREMEKGKGDQGNMTLVDLTVISGHSIHKIYKQKCSN